MMQPQPIYTITNYVQLELYQTLENSIGQTHVQNQLILHPITGKTLIVDNVSSIIDQTFDESVLLIKCHGINKPKESIHIVLFPSYSEQSLNFNFPILKPFVKSEKLIIAEIVQLLEGQLTPDIQQFLNQL